MRYHGVWDVDELYDLKSDPAEQHDVAATHPQRAQDMRSRLNQWLTATDAKMPKPDPQFEAAKRSARWETLKTSGYERLEKQHANFLSPDYKPNKDWGGSAPID